MSVSVHVDTSATSDAFDVIKKTMQQQAGYFINNSLSVIEREAKALLTLKSHPPGTPTPSRPGEPPALISGALRRSVRVGNRRGAVGVYTGQIGPSTVYARIQELGGWAGRNHRSYLPPRPYLKPAVFYSIDTIESLAERRVRVSMRSAVV